jgi:hypothetical protein
MLYTADGLPFSQGASTFLSRPATERERTDRIFVPLQIENVQTEAVVDTGGVYLVCHPEIAELIGLDPRDKIEDTALTIRGNTFRGDTQRLNVVLIASEGEGLEVEVTAFVPRLQPGQSWPWPSFMGFHGCLERVRFAVDPVTDTFYFGSISG